MKQDEKQPFIKRLSHKFRKRAKRFFEDISPSKRRIKKQWMTFDGIVFLFRLGIRSNDTVVDFGCGQGAYSIPASLLVGEEGRVFAVDRNPNILSKLKRAADRTGAKSITTLIGQDELIAKLNGSVCDFLLVFDVLHFFDVPERVALYDMARRILKPDGFLLIHPKHLKDDGMPSGHFVDMTAEDLVNELVSVGFVLEENKETMLWHDSDQEPGRVLKFRV
ncbi:MAG: class I SAM-dependent methyltransferase [Lentisphaerae bacterium]|nr:class I SAM-dependent methyltransferase [Lentisphaerota bacterium]